MRNTRAAAILIEFVLRLVGSAPAVAAAEPSAHAGWTPLGGVSRTSYCYAKGYPSVAIKEPTVFVWHCVDEDREERVSLYHLCA